MAEMFRDEDHSSLYLQFRPSVPESIIEKLINFCSQNQKDSKLDFAIDVGCGSGQCTKMLSPFFNKVLGLDISHTQIKEAQQLHDKKIENTEFFVGSEHCFPLNANSVDLVVSATALHWYKIIDTLNKADIITDQANLWEEEYENVPKIHYKEHISHKYDNFIWKASLSDLVGLVQSFALFQQYEKKMGKNQSENLIKDFYKSIKKALDEPEEKDPAEIILQYNFRFFFHATRKDS